jgi:putative endopeptidase
MRPICFILFCISIQFYGLTGQSKSSEIPERREFPLNADVSPCENFYDYVCSKAIDSFQLREDRSSHTFAFNDSAERLLEKKKTFFKDLEKIKPQNNREESLKNYYASCINQKSRASEEKTEVDKYKKLFASLKTRDQLLAWLEKSYLDPEVSPLSWGSISSLDNPLVNDIYLMGSLMTLPEKSYYKKEDVMKDFEAVALAFFKKIKSPTPEKDAKALLKFEAGLAEVTPAPQEFRQIINNRTFISRDELLKNYPDLKLTKLFAEIPEQTVIRNWIPESLKYLNGTLASASVEDIKPVFLFHSLYRIIDDSDSQFFQVKFDFQKKHFGGANQRPDRPERCTKRVMNIFSKEIDSILLQKIFPNFERDKFVSLAENIRSSIIGSLEKNKWLSKEAQQEAISKIKTARLHLVSPSNDKEWDFLPEAKYANNKFLQNEKTVSQVQQKKTLQEFRQPNDPAKWDMSPLTVNAYYDPSYNKFVMPIGILQYPFYDSKMSIEENLAAVGSVIGHELGHGVDDQGARYDSTGKQRQWMSMKDLAEFSKRTELLIGQFDQAKHNGKLTLGENIGDLVGVTASYGAAMKDPEFEKNTERQKAFFVGYARAWCEIKRPKLIETQLKTDPHSLGVARVNEQMKQQVAFKQAFQCKDTDPMVLPKEKLVRIW